VMAARELLSAGMFGLLVLVVPGAVATVGQVVADAGLTVLIAGAGVIGGYSYVIWYRSIRTIGVARAMALNISYAMWGVLFAWIVLHAPPAPLAITGCVVVSAGAVLTILSGRRGAERACYSAVSSRGVLSSAGISITAVRAARSSACRVVCTTRTLHIAWATTSPGTDPSI